MWNVLWVEKVSHQGGEEEVGSNLTPFTFADPLSDIKLNWPHHRTQIGHSSSATYFRVWDINWFLFLLQAQDLCAWIGETDIPSAAVGHSIQQTLSTRPNCEFEVIENVGVNDGGGNVSNAVRECDPSPKMWSPSPSRLNGVPPSTRTVGHPKFRPQLFLAMCKSEVVKYCRLWLLLARLEQCTLRMP